MTDHLERYLSTTNIIEQNISDIIEEVCFFQHTQTAILRNDFYLIKDKDTQAVFEHILCKNKPKISPNNHQKAFDLKHLGNQISVKSGSINNDILTISYSRTTEYATLAEKINYLSAFENLIVGIASEKVKSNHDSVLTQNKYVLYYFPAKQLAFDKMSWNDTPNQFIGKCEDDSQISVEIKKKMSDQPWINIPLDQIKSVPLIETTIISHKNRKYLVIDNLYTNEREYYDLYEQRKKIKSVKGLKKCSIFTTKAAMD